MRTFRAVIAGTIFVASVLAATTFMRPAQANEFLKSPVEVCRETLYAERDQQWQPKLKAAIRKYEFSREAQRDYERLKQELRDDIKYLGIFDPTAKGVRTTGEVLLAIKTSA